MFSDTIAKLQFRGAKAQVYIVACIAFACPGIYNSLSGLGGAGSIDPTNANNANIALYACFAVFGYFGGLLFNIFGDYANRILMGFGGLTYMFYTVAMYVAGHVDGMDWFAVLGGAVLGIGAGIFWTAQGAMMMAYAPEEKKGSYISIFWVIFNLGGLIGGFLVFGINYNNAGGANPATYFTFAGIMTFGACMSFIFLVSPKDVIREDGLPVEMAKATGPIEEFKNVCMMVLDYHMILLTPLFFGSNFFYTYQFNGVNGGLFSIRARGLNSALYWGAQMLAAFLFGQLFLDTPKLSRRKRAIWGCWMLIILFMIAWAMGCVLQLSWEGGFEKDDRLPEIDINSGGRYMYPFICLMLYGFGDAMLQTFSYWIMGAITNDLVLSARYSGYYKGIQSAGAAVAWSLDNGHNWELQLFVNWGLFIVSCPTLVWTCYRYVTDHTDDIGGDSSVPVEAYDKKDEGEMAA